ncbi:MAG: tetratricopeptide repeat protein [Desulfuromonas sp.]|nr:tetratricopeptide repeat protein [Desulfuromonas sp.]
MGLFRRLFAKSNDLAALRKAISQQRYADALLVAEELYDTELSDEEHNEVQTLAATAGDTLAKINLEEGLFLVHDNQHQRATDHLQLAQQQAVSTEIKKAIDDALSNIDTPQPVSASPSNFNASACNSCSSCGPQEDQDASAIDEGDHPDFDSQLELTLVSYPKELADRYLKKSPAFLQAFMLAHQGEDRQALEHLGKLPISEQDDLFDFELGSLMARHGHEAKACNAMRSCLKQNPDHLLAAETLVLLLVGMKKNDQALELVLQMLLEERDAAFCHAQLATLYHIQQDDELALSHCLQAIDAGHDDPRVILLGATLLERNNQLEQAEALYAKIPGGGGCSGGPNLYLAEFLLRQKRELRRILDAFNNACRQEPDNPRWQLRVAQTYLARGWKKKGINLLQTVVSDPRLSDELREEGQALLSQQS